MWQKELQAMKDIEFKLGLEDYRFLEKLTKTGKRNAHEFERAYILHAPDKRTKPEEIMEFFNVSRVTVWRIKKNYLKYGVARAIQG